MDLPRGDIEYAKTYCANFGVWYRGSNILNTGFDIDDPEERASAIDESWMVWSSFTRSYFMAMLSTLGGHSTFALQRDILYNCTPEECLGARAACDVFWKRDLALRGMPRRLGGWSLTPVQWAILADESTNAEVFAAVERTMEAAIASTLRTRRNILSQTDDGIDHHAGLQEDFDEFFGTGRPVRCNAKQRNDNYDGLLF